MAKLATEERHPWAACHADFIQGTGSGEAMDDNIQTTASPQVENGYARIANEILEALCRHRIPGEQMQCVFVVIRKTYGFGKKEDAISLSQFAAMTGMKRPNVHRALSELVSKKILGVIKNDTRSTDKYSLNKDYLGWVPVIKKDTTPLLPVINTDKALLSKMIPTKETLTKERKHCPKPKRPVSPDAFQAPLLFEDVWQRYPNKIGKADALRHFSKTVKNQEHYQDINKALDNYLTYLQTETWRKPQDGSRWFNKWQEWEIGSLPETPIKRYA